MRVTTYTNRLCLVRQKQKKAILLANVHGFMPNLSVGSTSARGASENLVHFACKHHVTSSFSNSRGVQVHPLAPPCRRPCTETNQTASQQTRKLTHELVTNTRIIDVQIKPLKKIHKLVSKDDIQKRKDEVNIPISRLPYTTKLLLYRRHSNTD